MEHCESVLFELMFFLMLYYLFIYTFLLFYMNCKQDALVKLKKSLLTKALPVSNNISTNFAKFYLMLCSSGGDILLLWSIYVEHMEVDDIVVRTHTAL